MVRSDVRVTMQRAVLTGVDSTMLLPLLQGAPYAARRRLITSRLSLFWSLSEGMKRDIGGSEKGLSVQKAHQETNILYFLVIVIFRR